MGHQPRKRFGQHFLCDDHVIQNIVFAINATESDHIVEIGPGLGVLTQLLLPQVKSMDAVELDRDIIPKLKLACKDLGELNIHSADALKFDFCSLVRTTEKLRIIGNLPYNISTPLMFHLIERAPCIQDMHFMLQKEVVDRIAAQPCDRNYGKLSVITQYHYQVNALFDVPPSAFSPPPKVDSAVVRLIPYANPPVELKSFETFQTVVAQSFAQRRKTLRNNLKKLIDGAQLESIGIDPVRRAETLSLQEFADIANHID